MKQIPVGSEHVALVDDEDYALVSQYRWYALVRAKSRTVYAYRRTESNGDQFMHKLLTEFTETDHINGNGLDNRRINLREATRSQNRHNTDKQRGAYTSEYKGVTWYRKSWRAVITVDGRQVYLGRYENEVDAAKAYDEAAIKYFGEFAYTNQGR